MRGIPKIVTDDTAILAAIDAYNPVTFHTSHKLGVFEGEGVYVKIGPVKAFRSQYDRLIRENDVKMAEHFHCSLVGYRTKYYGWRLVKSRFGETYVEYHLGGPVRSCDNAEAKEFYSGVTRKSMDEVIAAIDAGDLERAKKIKRQHRREGKI